jgi:hypothetical protein
MQLEFAELQYDSILRNSFNQLAFITFCAILREPRLSELRKLARNLESVFGGTYTRTCEQTFSCIKQNKLKFRPRISDVNLNDAMQIGIPKMESNVNPIAELRQDQVSH